MLCAAAVFWLVLARTVFGRHVRAIGDNEKAAEYAGLPIRAHQDLGLHALRAALRLRGRALRRGESPGQSERRRGLRTGCHRGGGDRRHAAFRRQGSISGTIVGTLIMGVLTNMLRLNNVDSNVEMMIKAVIIVLAVAVQRGSGNDAMTRRSRLLAAGAACSRAACGGARGKKQFVVAFSQANNAEPYRAAQNALMTKLFGAAARREAGDLRRAAGQQQAGGAGGDLHPPEARPADRRAQRARRADRRDGPGDGGEDPGDLPGARHPAAELHHLRAQRQRRHRTAWPGSSSSTT